MDSETKFCTKCGKRIPINAEFCSFCGAKQPQAKPVTSSGSTSEGTANSTETPVQTSPKPSITVEHTAWFKTPLGIGGIVVAVLIIVFGIGKVYSYNNPDTDSIASSMQSNITSDDDFGSATVHYSDSSQTFDIDIPESSTAMTNLDNGYPSIWNSLVKQLKTKSANLDNDYTSDYSYIQVMSPYNKKRVYLQIDHGNVKYNIADDLN